MNRWINGYIFPKMMLYVLTTVLLAVLIGIMCIFIAKIEDLEKDIETKLAVMKYSLGTYVLGLDQQEGKVSRFIILFVELVSKCRRFSHGDNVVFISSSPNSDARSFAGVNQNNNPRIKMTWGYFSTYM